MSRPVDRQLGLSLVELMVSVAISVAVVSSLVFVYVGSRGAYRNNEALARVQERGRFALEWIARDLRQAGYTGCLSRGAPITVHSYNKSKTPPGPPIVGLGSAIFGFEKPASQNGPDYVFSPPATVDHVKGDVVTVFSLDDSALAYVEKDYDNGIPANTKVSFTSCPALKKDDYAIISDCQRAAVFTVTDNVSCSADKTATITHANSGNGWPSGVCPYSSSSNLSCSDDFKFVPPFNKSDRAFIARFSQRGYFIGRPNGNQYVDRPPALYRFDTAGATEAVVDNIEDLDILYGVDTNTDGSVDAFLKADAVTAAGQWERVLSVRISLVATSGELTVQAAKGDRAALGPGQAAQVLYFRDEDGDTVADAAAPATDRQLRQVFTTTVALRNRLP